MKNCTIFYRSLVTLPLVEQHDLCRTLAKRLGLHVAAEYTAALPGDGERDEWIKRTRRGEVAIVAKLEVIAEPRTVVKRPTVDFGAALQDLIQSCERVVEAASEITSRDGKKWRELVEYAGNLIAAGRVLSPKRAKSMAAKRWAKAEPGIVKKWTSPGMERERKRWGSVWRDPENKNDVAAFNAFPKELRDVFGSPVNARRIFGRRRPDDPSAGGRGQKKPVKSTKRKR